MNILFHHPWPKALIRLLRAAALNCSRAGSVQVKREHWDRVTFAAKLNSVEEAPEPLRDAALAALHPHDTIKLLVFGPAQRTIGKTDPASLLAILDREWIIVTFCEHTGTQVYRCDFDHTLLLEMTDILLYGRLRVDFCKYDQNQSVVIFFNTVTSNLYQQAVQLLLNGMDKPSQFALREHGNLRTAMKHLPLKFKNGVAHYLPYGQRALELIHSPAVLRRHFVIFQRELAPEGVLVLTDKELLFISEEPAWSGGKANETAKYGYIVTHCPLSRIEVVRSTERDSLAEIEVKARGLTLAFCFSREKRAAVTAFVESTNIALTDRRSLFYQP